MKRYIKASMYSGGVPKTGQHMVLFYNRSPYHSTSNPYSDFGQDIEPSGEWMNVSFVDDLTKYPPVDWDSGYIEFKNPLVLEYKSTNSNGWKKDLSEMYNGKTGKELSDAVIADGYDAIVTIDSSYGAEYGDYFSECVNLKGKKLTRDQFFKLQNIKPWESSKRRI